MLQQIRIKCSELIFSVLDTETEIRDGAICHPSAYFDSIYRMLASMLAVLAHSKFLKKSNATTINQVGDELDEALGAEGLFSRKLREASATETQALNLFYVWFRAQQVGDINLSDLYELILVQEFPIRDGKLTAATVGDELNSVGSFYTPVLLADKCVELSLDTYIFKNTGIEHFSYSEKTEAQIEVVSELLRTSTFADYSCGTGSFLLAFLRFAQHHLGKAATAIQHEMVLKFQATEADPLAVEIARLQVLAAINRLDLYPQLLKNFIHGNPLIKPMDSVILSEFSFEFYNHNGLSIHPERMPICDVIVGNPPWGTVSFDLPYYLHIMCPSILELEDEAEIDEALDNLAYSHPKLHEFLLKHDEANDLASEAIYEDERFANSTMGGLQTNLLFTELTDRLLSERGMAALILKGSTLSDPSNKRLWNHLTNRNRVMARYDLINRNRIFNVELTEEFSILILGTNQNSDFQHQTELTHISEIGQC